MANGPTRSFFLLLELGLDCNHISSRLLENSFCCLRRRQGYEVRLRRNGYNMIEPALITSLA